VYITFRSRKSFRVFVVTMIVVTTCVIVLMIKGCYRCDPTNKVQQLQVGMTIHQAEKILGVPVYKESYRVPKHYPPPIGSTETLGYGFDEVRNYKCDIRVEYEHGIVVNFFSFTRRSLFFHT